MKHLRKIDPKLFDVFSLDVKSEIDCIAYIDDFTKAKKYFMSNEIVSEIPFINAIALRIDSSKLLEICNNKWVKGITKETNVMTMMNTARKVLGVDSNLGDGSSAIAYIDTGIFPHLDFTLRENRIIHFVDLINGFKQPYDDNGHGTFVAGAGSGNGVSSCGKFAGIAPNSKIIAIKALNKYGEAGALKILEAMQWIYDNSVKYNIRVVCMSFGSEPLGINDPIMKGAEVLWNKGIVMLAAAGNSGPEFETIKSPGISPKIITVGGLDDGRSLKDDYSQKKFKVAEFSSRGPALRRFKPDLIAPGVDITSCSNIIEKGYSTLSGTSVATPMIAGMCSLIINMQPKLNPDAVKKRIISTCTGITFNKNIEGAGYPDFNLILNK